MNRNKTRVTKSKKIVVLQTGDKLDRNLSMQHLTACAKYPQDLDIYLKGVREGHSFPSLLKFLWLG